jgi:xyloglucan-specific exo-beta-1,4-glucanase
LTSTLYFASRHDGLQRSRDSGRTWSAVTGFPVRGRGLPALGQRTNAGISFVVVDPATGGRGVGSRTVFVGVADPGERHLFRSDDGGGSWFSVAGQPGAAMLPVQAEVDAAGMLYVAYSNGVGPTGVTAGGVFRYDTRSGGWADITPERGEGRPAGGYMGLSVDRQRPGTLVVASMNRWRPGDTIWRSTDGGKSWRSLREVSWQDISATPFLRWGRKQADFGWWIAGVAIDPFDSNFVAYATGATVYATHDVASKTVISWAPWVEGVEQTAILTLTSPPEGPLLLSGFGDISGFAHEALNVSPATQFTSPIFSNTNTIDYAGRAPQIVVRSGTPQHRASSTEATLAFSTDYGRSWGELPMPSAESLVGRPGDAAVVTSADGSLFIVMTPVPSITRDRGKSWASVRGLSPGIRVIADRVDARSFYASDFEHSTLFVSTDGGSTFLSAKTVGLPADIRDDRPRSSERPWPLLATPGKGGDLWFVARGGLFHSIDAGRSFGLVRSPLRVEALGFGRAPPGRDDPALFAIGVRDDARAIWRSDDDGTTWVRLNDSRHEYGQRFRCIAGDPRVFGRVYVGTDGRGIVYGEPSSAVAR